MLKSKHKPMKPNITEWQVEFNNSNNYLTNSEGVESIYYFYMAHAGSFEPEQI
jgi:hypothetical protein